MKHQPPNWAPQPQSWSPHTASAAHEPTLAVILAGAFRGFRRQWFLMFIVFAAVFGVTLVYVVLAKPRYSATAALLVEPRRAQLAQGPQQPAADAASESGNIETQAEILRSEEIAAAVARQLQLTEDPDYAQRPSRLLAPLRAYAWFPQSNNITESKKFKRTVDLLKENLRVRRAALTSVIEISAFSSSPEQASRIANTAAELFVKFQLDASSLAARRAATWLNERILELRAQSEAADLAVSNFKSHGATQEAVTLRELASRAQTYRSLYDAFLARAAASQQDLFPIPDARVVSAASAPLEASFPRPSLVLPVGAAGALLSGVFAAWLRERLRNKVTGYGDLRPLIEAEPLGVIQLPKFPKRTRGPAPSQDGGRVCETVPELELAVSEPSSSFSETVRNIRVMLDTTHPLGASRVVGIVAAQAGAGTSAIAGNLAYAIASSGSRALLIDAKLRDPLLSRLLAPVARHGLREATTQAAGLTSEVIWRDKRGGVDFLPAVNQAQVPSPAEVLGSMGMRDLIKAARERYDYIVIDLPAINGSFDVKACAAHLDAAVLVVQQNKERIEQVQGALESAPVVAAKLLGLILTKSS